MIPLILLIFPAIYLLFLIVIILSGKYIILLPVLLMLFFMSGIFALCKHPAEQEIPESGKSGIMTQNRRFALCLRF